MVFFNKKQVHQQWFDVAMEFQKKHRVCDIEMAMFSFAFMRCLLIPHVEESKQEKFKTDAFNWFTKYVGEINEHAKKV